MTFMQSIANENAKYDILSYSIFVTIALYFNGANIRVVSVFFGATLYVLINLLFSAYKTYRSHASTKSF